LIVKQTVFINVNHAKIHSWNQPVLSNESKVSCQREPVKPYLGYELTTDLLRVRRATYCTTLFIVLFVTIMFIIMFEIQQISFK